MLTRNPPFVLVNSQYAFTVEYNFRLDFLRSHNSSKVIVRHKRPYLHIADESMNYFLLSRN